MEKQRYSVKSPTRGGARKNSGRSKGSKDQVTIAGLLEQLRIQSNGQNYEDLLIADFLEARTMGDKQTVLEYHNLILNKVMNTLAKIEVTDSQEAIDAKKTAFAEALAKLTGVNSANEKE